MRRSLLLLALSTVSCGLRPARYADAPAVTVVTDDAPIPSPRRHEIEDGTAYSDALLRRPVLDALDPRRDPYAGDVNALDEVPQSSWFQLETPDDGPPVAPLRMAADATAYGPRQLAVTDARGLAYILEIDPARHPELRTSALAISSRLVRAVGLLTPATWVVSLEEEHFELAGQEVARARFAAGPPSEDARHRVAATRWPVGIDIGDTAVTDTRADDPNDHVPHEDRRTLRSLPVLFSWLAYEGFSHESTRDVYVGPEGRGHVMHYLLGLGNTLGTRAAEGDDAVGVPGIESGASLFKSLITLGFASKQVKASRPRPFMQLGDLSAEVDVGSYRTTLPYAPMKRALPGDWYWMAKRLASISLPKLQAAMAFGRMSDPDAAAHLEGLLIERRRAVVLAAMTRVTPLEVESLEGDLLVLSDASRPFRPPAERRYRVAFLNDDGTPAAEEGIALSKDSVRIALPQASYLVVRVTLVPLMSDPPRAVEVHLVRRGGGYVVRGVRHLSGRGRLG
jgi:hypothetical protein